MKIIRLSTFLDFGGLETRLTNISHIQDENEWVFICLNKEGKAANLIRANSKRVLNLNTKPTVFSWRTFWKVYNALKNEKPDVVHTSGAEANFHGVLAAKFAGVPMIVAEEIGIPSHSKIAKFVFSLIYKLPKYIIGNSQQVLDAVHKMNFVPLAKLKKIDNPIIFKNLKNRESKRDDVFRISMVSRLEPVKNIEGVLNVLAKLKEEENSSIQLVIAGTGSIEDKLRILVDELGLQKEVIFFGNVGDPYPIYQNSDLYILNSFTEGFSNSLLEAMYSKTPVLSTAVGSAPEMIQDTINGFLIAPNNELELRKKIMEIMSYNTEKLKEVGECGYQTVLNNFSLENHIEKLMKLYQS